ncbi:CATRA conflict system CASPASE/TPR repeat-associated protein [Streptomyces abyssomicinicus]|uniref:CATRA conflict system CASPASE/TPR repeat-associated protein n=1 Tax=Streptomyces abyssomicinicus TaxID=574929 RepID=UPI0012505AFF|nr:CATRA conflict system CASPASE/TPR repeat-associated protein [Streptomyces abyssomicinicus]
MARDRSAGHALIVHTFAHLAGAAEDEENGVASVGLMWSRLRDRLGLHDPVPHHGPAGLPALAPLAGPGQDTGYRLLAACQRTGSRPAQAFAYVRHDVVAVTVVQFPAPRLSWGEMLSHWEAATTPLPHTTALGTVHVFRALQGRRTVGNAGGPGRLLASVPPSAAPPDGAWRGTPDGFRILWSAPPRSVSDPWAVVAVGPSAREDAFDAWAWHVRRAGGPAPLTRCLEGAARLRHQASVHRAHRPAFRALCARLSDASERLARLSGEVLAGGSSVHDVLAADAAIAALYVGDQGINQSLRDLRDMRHSARITTDTMTGVLPPGPDDGPGGPGGRGGPDQLGDGLIALLDDDIGHGESVKREADEIARTSAVVVQQRMQLHQQRTTVTQGAVLGSLLMALAAIQALSYRLPLPGALHAPSITWLSVLALSLPVQSLRRRRADGGSRRPTWFDRLSVFAMGAATGWLGASVGAVAWTDGPAHPLVSAACALASGLAALLTDRVRTSRGR